MTFKLTRDCCKCGKVTEVLDSQSETYILEFIRGESPLCQTCSKEFQEESHAARYEYKEKVQAIRARYGLPEVKHGFER